MSSRLRSFPVWFVLLAALLVPLKGALAAAGVLCHAAAGNPTAVLAVVASSQVSSNDAIGVHAGHHGDGHSVHGMATDTAAIPAPASPADGPGTLPGVQTCAICAAFCSVPPLLPVVSGVPAAMAGSEDAMPLLASAPPERHPDRLERPPRTI